MKKILGISLVAIMAVGAANAQIASQGYVDSITGALSGLSEGIDNTNLVAAINDVASDASSGASSVKSVTEGSTNGTIAVNDEDVPVHGLGTAAYTASSAYDLAGSASAAQTAAEGYTDTKIGTLPTDPSTSAPYTTVGAAIAAANTAAGNSVQSVALESGTNDGTVKLTVDGVATDNIAVTGLGSAAYTASSAYDSAGSASAAQTAAEGYTDTKIGTLPTDPSTSAPYTTVGAAIAAANTAAGNSVQSVALAGGTNDGTVKLTVDGVATDNIAVTGLGSAAYTDSTAYIPVSTNSTGTTGTQVLTRVSDGQGGYTYMWEDIERASGENE